MQFLFVYQTIVIDINSIESFCLAQATILDGDAELIDDFLWRYLIVIHGLFELRMKLLVLCAIFVDLLDGVEASDSWYELFSSNLTIPV